MSVLVTGGAGYIGSHMVWELLDHGEQVVVLDRLSTGFDWAVPPEAPLIVGDVGDSELVGEHHPRAFRRRDHPFRRISIVFRIGRRSAAYYENNTCKTRTLIETAVRDEVPHFIFSSTAAVYGAAGVEPVREDARLAPESPYGLSKLMSEWMLRDAAAAHDFDYTALRYFNVAGADPKGRTGQSTPGATHLIKVAAETALGKRPFMQVFGTDYDDARRHLHPRLYPCQRSRRGAPPGARPAARRRRQPRRQLRLRPRLFGARGDGQRSARPRRRLRGPHRPAGGRATRRRWSPIPTSRARSSAGRRNSTISTASFPTRWPGNAGSRPRIRRTEAIDGESAT